MRHDTPCDEHVHVYTEAPRDAPEGMVLDCIAMLLALCTAGLSDTDLKDICVHLSKAAVTLCGRALQC